MKKIISTILFTFLLNLITLNAFADSFDISNYIDEIPGIGLISDKISFDGITIKNFHFSNNLKYILVKPGEDVQTHFKYKIDASKLDTLQLHHFIIGLHNDGPQGCILHSLGIKDSKGKISFTLKAPEKAGAYQVRFCHTEGLSFDQSLKAWESSKGPSAKSIVGIVIVE